jgi:hypothetical protein
MGGSINGGTVYEIPYIGGSYASTPTLLAIFTGGNGQGPEGGVIADAAGDLFGTLVDGNVGNGSVFEIPFVNGSYASTPTTLITFNGADGFAPQADLIIDAVGDLFGATAGGGANNGDGTVFEIAKTGGSYASTPTTLATFSGANGIKPASGLIADAAGDLFGTSWAGRTTLATMARCSK